MSDLQTSAGERLFRLLPPWLESQMAGVVDMVVQGLVEPKQGLTSDTILFDAHWKAGGQSYQRSLVARIQRQTVCPMLANVFFQHDVMQAIAAHSDVAIAPIVFAEPGGKVLGQPFFLMDHVAGRVPADFPLFHAQGWVVDLPAEHRTRLWWNGINEMAKLHRIDGSNFGFIGTVAAGQGSLFYLHHFIGRWLEWAAQGQPFPALEAALAYLDSDSIRIAHSRNGG